MDLNQEFKQFCHNEIIYKNKRERINQNNRNYYYRNREEINFKRRLRYKFQILKERAFILDLLYSI